MGWLRCPLGAAEALNIAGEQPRSQAQRQVFEHRPRGQGPAEGTCSGSAFRWSDRWSLGVKELCHRSPAGYP